MSFSSLLLASLPLYPLLSFLILILFSKKLSWRLASIISVGAMAICALVSAFLVYQLTLTETQLLTSMLWQWFSLTTKTSVLNINVSFYLDALSAVMILVVTGVGFLIHLYAAIYMRSDENFHRFMAYMNLFIVAMLILVLADNLVLLYLGWEGVGLCSFLLIGFWYQENANVLAARKAFIVTRIGDTALAIGLFMLFDRLGQLTIVDINQAAQQAWIIGESTDAYWIALLLLGGAVGKSAQLPLQTWLPDAMAGPTPVSALIHAATMVTAGVYLIARMHSVFIFSPEVMNYVAWIGGTTLLLAGVAALVQTDIKRVLAYSTMSQIGYMMLALGAGAWSAGVFHLMTHAFFKALLFLTAGTIILALHHQQNIFKMGGLLKKLPFESGLFLLGLLCLVALPGTSGFFSKEAIIGALWSSPTAGENLWWCAILGALLTSIYSCRLFFLVCLGHKRNQKKLDPEKNGLLRASLVTLVVLSLFGGLIPLDLSGVFLPLSSANPDIVNLHIVSEPQWLHTVAISTPLIGIIFSWFYFYHYRSTDKDATNILTAKMANNDTIIKRFLRNGLGFDYLYSLCLVKPYCYLAKLNKKDILDQVIMLSARFVNLIHGIVVIVQNGRIRWYAATLGLGVIGLISVVAI
jgi:NADH-quinone oxidoreductase subunit L